MQRRDYVFYFPCCCCLCAPHLWLFEWPIDDLQTINEKKRLLSFLFVPIFVFLFVAVIFFFAPANLCWNGQARDVSKQYMQIRDHHLSFFSFCAPCKCLLEWTSDLFNQ